MRIAATQPARLLALAFTSLLLALIAACGGGGEAATDDRPQRFQIALEANGFTVKEGATKERVAANLVDGHALDSGAGNNAGQPYKAFVVPASPAVDGNSPERAEQSIFNVGKDEAIVYLGPTPPPCDYFSFTPFLFVRHQGSFVPKGDWLFASVGDPLNLTQLKTEEAGPPFGKNTMVIFAADQNVYNQVAALAQQAGYPAWMINPYVLPSGLLVLDNPDPNLNDSLVIIVRNANFTNPEEGKAYLANDQYAKVFRITPKKGLLAPLPFPTPRMKDRNWLPETSLVPGDLMAALTRLEAAIVKKHAAYPQKRMLQSMRWFKDSREVLEARTGTLLARTFVAGESSDTPYLRSAVDGKEANFLLGNDDLVVVYGVNHAATGLATYSSFGVYGDWVTKSVTDVSQCAPATYGYAIGCNDKMWSGVASMTSDSVYFKTSAEQYLPDEPLAKYLYAIKLVRTRPTDETANFSVVVDAKPPTDSLDKGPATYIPLDQPLMVGYRAYVNPATGVGPSYTDIVYDRAAWFGAAARP